MAKNILIVGGGGFARECYALIKWGTSLGCDYIFKGFLGHNNLGVDAKELSEYYLGDVSAYSFGADEYAVIGVGVPEIRQKIFDDLERIGAPTTNLIIPYGKYPDSVKMGKCNIILSSSLLANITIGNGNLFNGEVIVGHDCQIGNFNFFAPRCNILGKVRIGDFNTVGTGSVLLPSCKIGNCNKIAPLSAVYRGCRDNCHMLGNPATKI